MQKRYLPWILGWSLVFFAPYLLFAQENRMNELVTHARQTLGQAVQSAPFFPSASVAAKGQITQLVPGATLLELSAVETQKLWQQKPQYTIVSLPVEGQAQPLELELVLQAPLAGDFKVTTNTSNGQAVPYQPGAYYRGIIKGQPNTVVALSAFSDEIIAVATTPDNGNYVLGRLEKPGNKTEYILYSDKNLDMPQQPGCAAQEPLGYTEKMRSYLEESSAKTTADKCVRVFLECDYALNQNKGGVAGATNFITAVFNNVATLYANEQITTIISEVFVWTSADGYPTTSSSSALNSFRTTRTTFNGDLAHLAALGGANVGGIAWVDVLCNSSYRYAYSNIYSSYSTVPTYSWTVYVMTHEMGHNLGSPHTQSCSWVGGALDNCYTTEGGCAAGPAPTNGGTIMSYCHLTSYGINFNNGFGTQPGNLIRNRVNAATCLTACNGGGCTKPNNLNLRIVVDNYPGETTWAIRNSAGTVVASGGPYSGTPSGTTVNNAVCLDNGCYTLTMYDSYGDGICCSYGNGSYALINNANGTTIVSGGQFASQDVKNFCLAPAINYCGSNGNNATYEYIGTVQLGSINRVSGNNGGYANFTADATALSPGSGYTATLTPGFSGSTYTEYWTIFIDYNRDGDFTDAGEQVAQTTSAGAAAVTASFTVPAGVSGSTRMRVSMKYGGYATSCEAFTYGEVEDYTVVLGSGGLPPVIEPYGTVGAPLSTTVQQRSEAFSVYPNPAHSQLHIRWISASDAANTITLTDMTGRKVREEQSAGRMGENSYQLPVGNLAPGHYLLQVQSGAQQYRQKVTVNH